MPNFHTNVVTQPYTTMPKEESNFNGIGHRHTAHKLIYNPSNEHKQPTYKSIYNQSNEIYRLEYNPRGDPLVSGNQYMNNPCTFSNKIEKINQNVQVKENQCNNKFENSK